MAFSVTGPVSASINGVRYLSWTVVENGSLTGSSEWSIVGLPVFFTVTLFEASTSSGTINPKLGLTSGWSVTSVDHVADNDVAAQMINNDARLRVTAPGQTLYGQSGLAGGSSQTITTRITVMEGH